MNTSTSRLFIGMPVYNGERFLARAIESVLGQSDGDFTLVISDNASTDGTAEICREFAARDKRIQVITQPKTLKPQDHFLFLLGKAATPYFMWAACDDEWHPDFTRLLLDAHTKNPGLALAFAPYSVVDEQGVALESRPRVADYRGATPTARIWRLCRQWDDGVMYGIFNRAAVEGLEFPVWWGVNRSIPMRIAYPALCYILAKGDYALVGDEPLWFNRIHNSKAYRVARYDDVLRESAATILRNVQLNAECLRQIQRGTNAWGPAVTSSPAVAARISFDQGLLLMHAAKTTTKSVIRRFRPAP